jgi:hypothetical protein
MQQTLAAPLRSLIDRFSPVNVNPCKALFTGDEKQQLTDVGREQSTWLGAWLGGFKEGIWAGRIVDDKIEFLNQY